MNLLARYTRWLHTRWPAGTVEKLPDIREDGTTSVPGVRITGDLTGVPLLKFSSDTGSRAVRAILAEPDFRAGRPEPGTLDLAIVGAGVSGVAAAIEAKKAGLDFRIFEASEAFATVVNFPKGKPIYTYPTGMTPTGGLQFRSEVHPKEVLLADMERARRQAGVEVTIARIERIEPADGALRLHHADGTVTKARRAIVAIGKSGDYRRLGVPGEELDKVYNRLHDPNDFAGQRVLVVGGGDSALESAIALASAGARVTLSYRKGELSRPKPDNLEALRGLERNGSVRLALGTEVTRIEPEHVALKASAGESRLENDVVFTMLGREAPLAFFRRSGIPIRGEWKASTWAGFVAFFLFCVFLYNWKANGAVNQFFQKHGLFPYNVPALSSDPATLTGTLSISLKDPGFYYSLAYCMAVLVFGIRRIRRRRTPYVTRNACDVHPW
jgi:thioredoxin reductase